MPTEEDFDKAWGEVSGEQASQADGEPDDSMVCSVCGSSLEEDENGNEYCPQCNGQHSDTDEEESAAGEDEDQNTNEGDEPSEASETDDDSGSEEDWKAEAEKWKQKYKSWEGRYEKEKQQFEDKISELQQEIERLKNQGTNKDQGSQDTSQSQQVSDQVADDEQIRQFKEEFPDLYEPIQRLIEQKSQEAVGSVREEIEPVKNQVQSQAHQDHIQRISEVHSDWQEIVNNGELQQWIDSLPSWMGEKAQQVAESGTTEEVIQLLHDYKKDKQSAQETPSDQGVERSKKEKAKQANAVRRHSAKPKTKQTNANDFDSAWDEAVKS